jgi:hypothetical protein
VFVDTAIAQSSKLKQVTFVTNIEALPTWTVWLHVPQNRLGDFNTIVRQQ